MGDILFLAHRIPWPADRGDKIRSHNILRRLAELGSVHVAAFADDDRDMGFVDEMRGKFLSVHVEKREKPQWRAGVEALKQGKPVSLTSFASPSMKHWVDMLLASGRVDRIMVFSSQMAQYVPEGFQGRFIMDFVDVDSAKFESYALAGNPLMRWVYRREAALLAGYEAQTAQRADASLFVSEAEAALFRERSNMHPERILSLSNGIDTVAYDPAAQIPPPVKKLHGPVILFTGQMDYRPNIEAVTDFAQNAMPVILKKHPAAKFAIVGRSPTPAVNALGKLKGVEVIGAVDDIRSWLAAATVVVAPLRIARGIQNKVLEAMAMAKPVVASSAAAEGISAKHGQHFIVAPNLDAEVQAVIMLLQDSALASQIGQAARNHVVAHYSWQHQLKPMEALLSPQPLLAEAAE